MDHVYETTLQHRKKILNERRFVDVNIVYKGIEYYRFLMECLPPATVPGKFNLSFIIFINLIIYFNKDVPFMSALLEIVS